MLKSRGIHKGFLRLFALNPACVCEISVIFFVFRHTLGTIEAVAVGAGVAAEAHCASALSEGRAVGATATKGTLDSYDLRCQFIKLPRAILRSGARSVELR